MLSFFRVRALIYSHLILASFVLPHSYLVTFRFCYKLIFSLIPASNLILVFWIVMYSYIGLPGSALLFCCNFAYALVLSSFFAFCCTLLGNSGSAVR